LAAPSPLPLANLSSRYADQYHAHSLILAQNKFYNAVLSIEGLPNPEEVAKGGITAFLTLAPAEFIPQITDISIDALRNAYYAPVAIL
jgi:hypothetical protein